MNHEKEYNKICGRLCVELVGHLASPLLIGSGEQEQTDSDVIVGADGRPFIPGSALAGALRAYSRELECKKDWNKESDWLFGAPKGVGPGTDLDRQSRIFCYDTFLEHAETGIRDGIKLGEHKTPILKSKYEIQMIERNAGFRMRIEIIEREDCLDEKKDIQKLWKEEQSWIRGWVQGFNAGELRIGAKSRRGFGKLEIEKVRVMKFHMAQREEYLAWLDWNWDNEEAFEYAECMDIGDDAEGMEKSRTEQVLEVPLSIPYTLLVRTYSTAFAKKGRLPDYEQLTVGEKGEQAVIPGSSLAGAFRSHIAKIVKRLSHLQSYEEAQKKLDQFFGTWIEGEKEESLCASKITFEEVLVDGGHRLPVTRIAVDRFTGGTVANALYEGVPWAGGTALLRIRWKKEYDTDGNEIRDKNKIICGMLLWAILDLQAGILPVGGETAVGRGIFCKPQKHEAEICIDGEPLDDERKKAYMRTAAIWCREVGKHECAER